MTAPLQPVLDLFEQLQQTNSYAKVIGNPTFSVSALLNQEIKAMDQKNPSVLFKALCDIKGSVDLMHDKVSQLTWWRPRKIQHIVRDLDQAALNWAYNDGYLPTTPTVVVVPERNILKGKRIPAFYLDLTDEVRMVGDNEGKLNLQRYIQEGVAKRTDLNVSVDTSKMEEHANISRLYVLFHEASHHVFSHISSPFVAPQGFDKNAATHLNDWVFNPNVKNTSYRAFNEIFADIYGAMMLLRGLNFSNKAIETVREFALLRIEMDAINHVSTKKSFKQQLMKYGSGKLSENVHVGGNAVLNLLGTMDNWKDMNVDDLKEEALRLSSEGLVQWLLPHHLDVHIDNEQHTLVKPGNRALKLISLDMPTLDMNINAEIINTLVYSSPRERPAHPAGESINAVAQEVRGRLEIRDKMPNLEQDGIFPVLAHLLRVAHQQRKVLKELKDEEDGMYERHLTHFDKQSAKAQDIIQKGFDAFYHDRGPVQDQIVALRGKSKFNT